MAKQSKRIENHISLQEPRRVILLVSVTFLVIFVATHISVTHPIEEISSLLHPESDGHPYDSIPFVVLDAAALEEERKNDEKEGKVVFTDDYALAVSDLGEDNAPIEEASIPTVTLGKDKYHEDVNLPLLGAGTWLFDDLKAYRALCNSFEAGYTMVDTAFGYANQNGVGRAIKDCWKGTRKELFVLTKVHGGADYNWTMEMHRQNLDGMGLDYVDLLLVHFPADWAQTVTGKKQRQAQWRAMEDLYNQGKARAIGVSHYCSRHIDDILEIAQVKPVLNQVEYHLGVASQRIDVLEKCTQENMYVMSYSPLNGPNLGGVAKNWFNDGVIASIADKHNKTGAQVALRFIVQQALEGPYNMGGVIPKSTNTKHILENRKIFDFELEQEEMSQLMGSGYSTPADGDCDVL